MRNRVTDGVLHGAPDLVEVPTEVMREVSARPVRRVERSGHLLGHDSPVAGRVDDAEQLGVDVRKFLPESGFGVFMFVATP
jgi:hypothetical protein